MVKAWFGGLCLLLVGLARAQEIPDNELQVNLNGYFDSFNVQIVYPSVSFTRRLSDSSSVNVRYLVDVISAASMRSLFKVDGVTSATDKEDGGGDNTPDEVRHELGVGLAQLFSGGTLSLNLLYSREHDYRSLTVAGTYSYPLARKNTILQLGAVRSWDKVFPQNRTWKKDKDVYTFSVNLTQILSKRALAQAMFSYNLSRGYLADAYQVVQILDGDQVRNFEPVHPARRRRAAAGLRANLKVYRDSALQLALRYYWDDWDVKSFTAGLTFKQHVSEFATVGLGVRGYVQGRAFFFKPRYAAPEPYMTVDSKLDDGYSVEYQFTLDLNGGRYTRLPLLTDENVQLNVRLNFYQRHTATPNWHSRARELYAYILSFGVRYRF